jgi:hypothetical protein
MPIDIYQLDKIDPESSQAERAMEKFIDSILEQFHASPEGKARLQDDPDMGFWAAQLIDYGFGYDGVTLPKMTADDVKHLLNSIFPRKISFESPEDLDETIPELIAFWQYLKREYQLEHADEILRFLREAEPEFKKRMTDPSLFGMAKSFLMLGHSQGYDMTNEAGMSAFALDYNTQLSKLPPIQDLDFHDDEEEFFSSDIGAGHSGLSSRQTNKKKNKRKMEKASRKKNRKKRK